MKGNISSPERRRPVSGLSRVTLICLLTPGGWRPMARTIAAKPLLRLFPRPEIQRRQFDLRDLDPDLVDVLGTDRLVQQDGHGPGESDHQHDHDRLQSNPGQRAPVDVGALDLLRCDAAQVKQRETERRMHERRLHVDAEHDAEPDQRGIRADHRRQHLLRDRRDHRQDDEGDLEEIEEERQEEDEEVDEDQEAPDAAGQRRQHVLEPDAAGDAEEHHREAGRADQDEHHHGGDAHGRLVALLDQVAQFGNADGLEADPDHREIGDRRTVSLNSRFSRQENSDHGADAAGDDADDQDLVAGAC